MTKNANRTGIALIITMIILAIISALALSLVTMSSTNLQITDNRQKASKALASAQSGLDIMRYFLDEMYGINTTSDSQCIASITSELGDLDLGSIEFTPTGTVINFNTVTIDSAQNQSFTASLIPDSNSGTVRLSVTGFCGNFSKTITVDFNEVPTTIGGSVFAHGVATRGPLYMSGQAEMADVNLAVSYSVYIDGGLSGDSFSITNQASVAGNVYISDPYATYSIGDKAVIGGDTGSDAEEHIITDAPTIPFPIPNTSLFEEYATGPLITSETVISSDAILNNAKIAANTNPTFSGDVAINGILFIEQPNVVTFSGKATVTGIIVGDGVVGPSTADNRLVFAGQVQCSDVSELTGAEFDDIKLQTGTFILAPGFGVSFSGQTQVDNGVIAASGISFTGQAGGVVNGTIINYSSTQPVDLGGQSSLLFNHTEEQVVPAGFSLTKKLDYMPVSYSEPVI
jgi:Tfp pilus assembly protein PilE